MLVIFFGLVSFFLDSVFIQQKLAERTRAQIIKQNIIEIKMKN